MNYRHRFGSNVDSIRVDGVTYTREDYCKLPSKAEREALRELAEQRCCAANTRHYDALREAQKPLREAFEVARKEFWAQDRFRKRYAGRADHMRLGERALRATMHDAMRVLQDNMPPVDGCTYPAAVDDMFLVWEEVVETPFERFERLLSHHDWYYSYSDDHGVWSAGERRSREIRCQLDTLKSGNFGEAAQLLYNQKCPWLNDDGSQKNENP